MHCVQLTACLYKAWPCLCVLMRLLCGKLQQSTCYFVKYVHMYIHTYIQFNLSMHECLFVQVRCFPPKETCTSLPLLMMPCFWSRAASLTSGEHTHTPLLHPTCCDGVEHCSRVLCGLVQCQLYWRAWTYILTCAASGVGCMHWR